MYPDSWQENERQNNTGQRAESDSQLWLLQQAFKNVYINK